MSNHSFDLPASAYAEMLRQGFQPDFPDGTDDQIEQIRSSLKSSQEGLRDLCDLFWSSIDNDTSRDLDQIEVAERVDGGIRVRVGVADVSASVKKNTPIDRHAAMQTKTVYTGVRNFPMLPNELSTDLTSLNENVDRSAMVVEFVVDARGQRSQASIFR